LSYLFKNLFGHYCALDKLVELFALLLFELADDALLLLLLLLLLPPLLLLLLLLLPPCPRGLLLVVLSSGCPATDRLSLLSPFTESGLLKSLPSLGEILLITSSNKYCGYSCSS